MIPITSVRIDEDQEALVLEVLRSGQVAAGQYVERLEEQFAEIHQVRHAVAVNNGTTALIAAMKALDLQPGDEVITTPFTFVATLNAILDAGATARFADIGDDFNIDPAAVQNLINDRTKALMPVHLYGLPAQMDLLTDLADAADLAIIEDAAQAVGASFRGQMVGSFGIGCFSLYATKNISTGEGGMVTTDDDEIADRLRVMRNQGMRQRYQYEMAGNNYRLTNLAAALGIPQLDRIDQLIEARNRNADRLRAGLAGIEGLMPPLAATSDRTHVQHQFTIRVLESAPVSRDEFVEALAERDVGSGIYYPKVVFDYDCYRAHPGVVQDHVPRAMTAAEQVVSLPVHQHLTTDEIDRVIEAVGEVMQP